MKPSIEHASMRLAMRRRLNEQARTLMKEAEESLLALVTTREGLSAEDVYVPAMDKLSKDEIKVVREQVDARILTIKVKGRPLL